MLQHKLRPSIARINVQLDPRHAASKHTTAPINRTRPSPRKLSPDGTAHARKHTSDYSLHVNHIDGRWFFTGFAYLHDISETDTARITKHDLEMFHDESWNGNPSILVSKCQRSRVSLCPQHCRLLHIRATLGYLCCSAPPHKSC